MATAVAFPTTFGIVKLRATGIGVCPEDLFRRVTKSRPSAAGAMSKISRVLMEDGRKNSFRHEIADDEIGIRRAEIPAKSRPSLSEGSVGISELTLGAKYGGESDGAAVKRVF